MILKPGIVEPSTNLIVVVLHKTCLWVIIFIVLFKIFQGNTRKYKGKCLTVAVVSDTCPQCW